MGFHVRFKFENLFFVLAKCFTDYAKKKYGRIVNVSAMAGLSPSAGRGAYGISKSAIAAFTHIAGEEAKSLSDSNITVNAIAPSILLTESNKHSASKEETKGWVTLEQAASCYWVSCLR